MPIFKPASKARRAPALECSLDIERLGHDGRGIARPGGKTAFVAGALPGERVRARRLREERRYDEYECLAVERASGQRVNPPCPLFGACGGCSLQHLDADAQLAHKQAVLEQQLWHFGKLRPDRWLAPVSGPAWHYRQRARFTVEGRGERLQLGFRARASHQLVAVSACAIAHPEINARLEPLRQCLSQLEQPPRDVEIAVAGGEPAAVGLYFRGDAPRPEEAAQLQSFCKQQGIAQALWSDGRSAHALWRHSSLQLRYPLPGGLDVEFSPGDFTQVNLAVNAQLVALALELLAPSPGDRVLDLFSGLGNFSLPLARRSAQVLGLEYGEEMVERARGNARRHGVANAEFRAADLGAAGLKLPEAECVLLDPPREGAAAVVECLCRARPARLVYVSCNPSTLARDGQHLLQAGYRLEAAGAVDMFPHTAHLEAIALFTRR